MSDLVTAGLLFFLSAVVIRKQPIVFISENNDYDRKKLAVSPAYGVFIGNLNQCVKNIEKFFLDQVTKDETKETMPFILVSNPPRHGKSLLLDQLFLNDDDVVVVPITYNTGSSFDAEVELTSVNTALRYFWLRVFKSLSRSPHKLDELAKTVGTIRGLNDVISELENKRVLPRNIFKDVNKLKNIVICVDEFSKLVDGIKDKIDSRQCWTKDMAKTLILSIHAEKKLRPFFVQFVFTGFTTNMREFVDASSKIKTNFNLTMCDFTAAKPLLEIIVKAYEDDNRIVPALLFQSLKMTPGLVGQWAEFIKNEESFVDSLDAFRKQVSWLSNITADEVIRSNWDVLVSYLRVWEVCDVEDSRFTALDETLIKAMVFSSMKDSSQQHLHMVPCCFAVIIKAYHAYLIKTSVLQADFLMENLEKILQVIAKMNLHHDKKDGKSFEEFVFYALQVRFYLRELEKKIWTLQDLFGSREYLVRKPRAWGNQTQSCTLVASLHIISSKLDLSRWLLPPLYFLFPVDLPTLSREFPPHISSVSTWITELKEQNILEEVTDVSEDHIVITRQISDQCSKMVVQKPKCDLGIILEELWDHVYKAQSFTMNEKFEDLEKSIRQLFTAFRDEKSQTLDENTKKDLLSFSQAISTQVLVLIRSFQEQRSFIRCNDGKKATERLDLVLTWTTVTIDVDSSNESLTEYHVAAIELKDRRSTEPKEWQAKFDSLFSYRCAVWWLQALFRSHLISFHIVFAGREET